MVHRQKKVRFLSGLASGVLALAMSVSVLAVPTAAGEQPLPTTSAAETAEVTQGTVTAFRDTLLSSLYPELGTPEADLNLPTHLNATVGGQAVRVPIEGWVSQPQYNPEDSGVFIFTPLLPFEIDTGTLAVPSVTVIPGGNASLGAIVGSVVDVSDFAGLKNALADPESIPEDSSYTIRVLNDVTVTETLTIPEGKTVTIVSGETPAALRRGFTDGPLLSVPASADGAMSLYLANITLSGEGLNATAPLLNNMGTTTIEKGARLVDNHNTATQGGAVYNKGTLLLSDVEINGNTASSGAAVYNAGSVTLSDFISIPEPGGLATAAEGTLPVADMLLGGSVVSIERTDAFTSSGDSKLATALDTFTLSENDLSAFKVSGGGFTYSLSSSKEAVLATPINYSIQYSYDEAVYSNPSANLGKFTVFSQVLTLMAPSATAGGNTAHFLGWYTQLEAGKRVDTLSSQNITGLADADNVVKLYARFAEQAPLQYNITYQGYDASKYQHGNPASFLDDEVLELEALYLSNAAVPDGTFEGWYTQPEGGQLVTQLDGAMGEELADGKGGITLYARWAEGTLAAANAVSSAPAARNTEAQQPGAAPPATNVVVTLPPAAPGVNVQQPGLSNPGTQGQQEDEEEDEPSAAPEPQKPAPAAPGVGLLR